VCYALSMEISEVAGKAFGNRPFTAADLLAVMDYEDLPPKVQYASEKAKSLGQALRGADGIQRVGTVKHSAIYRVTRS